VRAGREGHGQRLPRPPVHRLLHGVFSSVSIVCVVPLGGRALSSSRNAVVT